MPEICVSAAIFGIKSSLLCHFDRTVLYRGAKRKKTEQHAWAARLQIFGLRHSAFEMTYPVAIMHILIGRGILLGKKKSCWRYPPRSANAICEGRQRMAETANDNNPNPSASINMVGSEVPEMYHDQPRVIRSSRGSTRKAQIRLRNMRHRPSRLS